MECKTVRKAIGTFYYERLLASQDKEGLLKELYIAPSLNNVDESNKRMMFYRCSNLTFRGRAGSYIETFAKEQNILFVAE